MLNFLFEVKEKNDLKILWILINEKVYVLIFIRRIFCLEVDNFSREIVFFRGKDVDFGFWNYLERIRFDFILR